jgi:hypothetical protein
MIPRAQRIRALRLRGQWTASANNGVRIGRGAGFSWREAVEEAIRDLDEKHQAKERSCGTA